MKKSIISALSLIFALIMFVSCDENYDDLMTGNAKTGGLLVPTSTIPYKLGSTAQVDITIEVPQGPGIQSINVYRTFTGKVMVLDQTIDVGAANTSGNVTKSITFNYSQLVNGLDLPADESELTIGDKWTLTYVAVMADGREVVNSNATSISVANFFAGSYEKQIKYFHPTAGGTYPTTPYSGYTENVSLEALNASDCWDWFGVWENTRIIINIDSETNAVQLTFEDRSDAVMGDPNNAENVCSYDPVTGIIKIYYYYPGAGGNRIFWAEYTPK